jgi:hypothetical protein
MVFFFCNYQVGRACGLKKARKDFFFEKKKQKTLYSYGFGLPG